MKTVNRKKITQPIILCYLVIAYLLLFIYFNIVQSPDEQAWTAAEISLKSKLAPPFYLEVWFLCTLLSTLFLGIIIYQKWVIQQLKARNLFLENSLLPTVEQVTNQSRQSQTVSSSNSHYIAIDQSTADKEWLKKVETNILKNMDDARFNLGFLAAEIGISQRQLGRKVKRIAGMSSSDYLKNIRLSKAQELIQNKTCKSVKEVAKRVGYSDSKYFSVLYKLHFGHSPSECI